MSITETSNLLETALIEWRKRQTIKRNSVSLNNFADYLGVSRPIVSQWLNGTREPSRKNIMIILPKLVNLLGSEVYDKLGLNRPDPILNYVISHWDNLSPERQHAVKDQVEQYLSEKTKPSHETDNA